MSKENVPVLEIEGEKDAEVMSINSAIRKLSRDGAEFLAFRNIDRENHPLTIVYFRDGGDCGLLEV